MQNLGGSKKISLVIIDDHNLIRQCWSMLFAASSKVEVIGDSGEFNEAVEMIKTKRPDVVLLDVNLGLDSGLDAVPIIRKFSPGTKIIVITMHNNPAYAKRAIKLGAKGYLTKNATKDEMYKAIEEVMKGETYVGEEIRNILTDRHLNSNPSEPDISSLSRREIEIIKLIKSGLSSPQIAAEISIAIRTVEAHRHNILKKLKLKNTATLINFINTTDLNFI